MTHATIPHIGAMKRFLEGAAEMLPVPADYLDEYVEIITAIQDGYHNGVIPTVSESSLEKAVEFVFVASRFSIEQAALQKIEVDAVSDEDRQRMRLESPRDYMEFRRRWYEAEKLSKRALKFRLSLDTFRRGTRPQPQKQNAS